MTSVFLGLLSASTLLLAQASNINVTRECQFDPQKGMPNIFGMRSYLSIREAEGSTTFIYESFPSNMPPLSAPINGRVVQATVASTHELTFYEMSLEEATQVISQEPGYMEELISGSVGSGYPDRETMEIWFDSITCR